jgi:hypothetical protein
MGRVTLMDGSTVFGTAPVGSNGTPSFTISDLPLGRDRITAGFSGGHGLTYSRAYGE